MINNSSSLSASNFTVHQTFQTDVTVNGALSPIDSANAIKRQQKIHWYLWREALRVLLLVKAL